jgi:hypothetical protein
MRHDFGTTVAILTGSNTVAKEALNVAAQTVAIYVNTASADAVPVFDTIETNGAGAVLSQIHHNGQKKRLRIP